MDVPPQTGTWHPEFDGLLFGQILDAMELADRTQRNYRLALSLLPDEALADLAGHPQFRSHLDEYGADLEKLRRTLETLKRTAQAIYGPHFTPWESDDSDDDF